MASLSTASKSTLTAFSLDSLSRSLPPFSCLHITLTASMSTLTLTVVLIHVRNTATNKKYFLVSINKPETTETIKIIRLKPKIFLVYFEDTQLFGFHLHMNSEWKEILTAPMAPFCGRVSMTKVTVIFSQHQRTTRSHRQVLQQCEYMSSIWILKIVVLFSWFKENQSRVFHVVFNLFTLFLFLLKSSLAY